MARTARHPYTPIDHSRRLLSTLVITAGVLVDALQHAAPQLEQIFPGVHWIAPAITAVGFLWLSSQKIGTADHQATIAASQRGK